MHLTPAQAVVSLPAVRRGVRPQCCCSHPSPEWVWFRWELLPFPTALSLSPEELKAPLEEYVNKRYPGLVKVVRNQKREGLIRARIEGWKAATGQVTGFFDAHVEFTAGW